MNVLTEIQNDISGAQALADWLGGEPPVSRGVAEFRAEVCVQGDNGKPCPLNVAPGWWEKNVKDRIARWITRELEEKHRLQLNTLYDGQLHMCRPCGCCVRLKIWAPVKVIHAHTSDKARAEFPDFCWQKKALDAYSARKR
jgi:hypothetical protein